ncbi:MAG: hypothetical protein ACRDRK_15495 [Pseudonocardia sp.]
MITLIVAGFVALAVVAIVVEVIDIVQASAWREIARDRRRNWEQARRLEPHGDEPWTDAGQDD